MSERPPLADLEPIHIEDATFQVYKDLEEAKVETQGYGNRADAERVVAEARVRASR